MDRDIKSLLGKVERIAEDVQKMVNISQCSHCEETIANGVQSMEEISVSNPVLGMDAKNKQQCHFLRFQLMFFCIFLNFQFIRVYPSFNMVKSRKKCKVFSNVMVVADIVVFSFVKSEYRLGLLLFWMVVHNLFI